MTLQAKSKRQLAATAMHRTASLLMLLSILAAPCATFAADAPPNYGDGGLPAFYTWTGPVPNTAGTLLRSEPLPATLSLVNAAEAKRILYTSRDADGHPVVVSGALFLPKGRMPKGGWPLIAWAHGTTGLADICAPSSYPRSVRDSHYLNNWLQAGYAIVASDYLGLGTPGRHPYTNFRDHAYAVLDSIRAAQTGVTGISRKALLLGQSQGAGTVVAAAGYAPNYAPDLTILGTIATGVPSLTKSALSAGVPATAGDSEAAVAFTMMAVEYLQSEPATPASQLLTPIGLSIADLTNHMCFFDILHEVQQRKFTPQMLLQPGALRTIFTHKIDDRTYPTTHLTRPIFIGIGNADTTTVASGARAIVTEFCKAGSDVEAHLYTGLDHDGAVNASFKDSSSFARKLLTGAKIAPLCNPTPQS